MVAEHYAFDGFGLNRHFKRIAFNFGGNRADKSAANPLVVRGF